MSRIPNATNPARNLTRVKTTLAALSRISYKRLMWSKRYLPFCMSAGLLLLSGCNTFLPNESGISKLSLSQQVSGYDLSLDKDALSDFLALNGGDVPPPEMLHDFIKNVAMIKSVPDLLPEEAELGLFHLGEVLIPKGRSPEAPFTDFRSPRSLIAFQVQPEGRYLYIGYSPSQNLLQFISEDESNSPKMRFSEVHDYGQSSQKLFRDVDNTCISCHQYRRLIFPIPGWSETTENTKIYSTELSSKTFLDKFASDILSDEEIRRQHDVRFDDEPSIGHSLENSANIFQDSVRDGLDRVQNHVFCSSICKGDYRCLRNEIDAEIAQNLGASDPLIKSLQLSLSSSLISVYQTSGISSDFGSVDYSNPSNPILHLNLPSSDIEDRNPLDENGNLIEFHEGDTEIIAGEAVNFSPKLVRSYPIISLSEPQAPINCILKSQDQKRLLRDKDLTTLIKRTYSSEFRSLLDYWPQNADAVLSFISADSEYHPIDDTSPEWDKNPTVVSSPLPPVRSAMQIFQNVCSDCHQSSDELTKMYLPLNNLEKMKTFVGKTTGKSPLYYIQNQLMPPPGSGDEISDSERTLLTQSLE